MELISTAARMTALSKEAHRAGKRVGLVPTMGALHEGHLSLVRTARTQSDIVVVSIFVNPTQFGPKEDFSKYPRTLDKDSELLQAEKVDYVFNPTVDEMYPSGSSTWVTVEGLSEKLDGRSRPGHFRGVTTVVSKLFNIVQPDLAFFGQKDAAQAAVIRKMVRELGSEVHIVVCPIVREKATALYRSLTRVQTLADQGEADSPKLIAAGKQMIAEEPQVRLDYFEIV